MKIIKAFFLFTSLCASAQASVIEHFEKIKTNPTSLYEFFKSMPKGGELHYHLAGGPYPETMLKLIAQGGYCLNTETMAISKVDKHCDGVPSQDIMKNPELYSAVVRSWSMKDFKPGKESGHDHFFNSFLKFMPIVLDFRPALLADVMQRASAQNEQYLEILDIPDNAHSLSFAPLIKDARSFTEKSNILLTNSDFQKNVQTTIQVSEDIIAQARQILGCAENAKAPGCEVKIKLIYYVLREQPLDAFFAQALNAFAAVAQSSNALVGVNAVQAEDGIIALRDYRQHMDIFKYLHAQYPQVNISLHAGELTDTVATPEDLTFHVHEAILTGQAQRIGHGVDIRHEDEVAVKYMAKHQIPVEINLTSNQSILQISGAQHPLNYYLAQQVPVVLSTDDEGILRTDLSEQYVTAVLQHRLDYPTLKQINRNTLTYAFIPGQSIWANPAQAKPVKACLDWYSKSCALFLKGNEKGQLQWNLEQKLREFEAGFK